MKSTTINITTNDNINLGGQLFKSENSSKTIAIHIPGMIGNIYSIKFYEVLSKLLPKAGIVYLATQTRNYMHAQKHGDDYYAEDFIDCVSDLIGWFDYAKHQGYTSIWFIGNSLGPSKIVHWYTQTHPDISGMVFLSPSDMVGLVHDPLGIKDHQILYPQARKLVKTDKPNQVLSQKLWGVKTITAQAYLSLFDKNSAADIFNYANHDFGWHQVQQIKCPVLAITGTQDDGICQVMGPYHAMDLLKQKLSNAPLCKTIVYQGATHNFKGHEQQLSQDIIEFISQAKKR